MRELSKEFKALYAEVVTEDVYGLKTLNFTPDVIFDLGANIGCFAEHANNIFPLSKIVCVEPDESNFDELIKTILDLNPSVHSHFFPIQKAIGQGQIYRHPGAVNGAHESYISATKELSHYKKDDKDANEVPIEGIMLDQLFNDHVKEGQSVFVKMDIEGNEHAVFEHEPSIQVLKKVDCFVAELHWVGDHEDKRADKVLEIFKDTHDCFYEHIYFYATKR